MRVITTVEDLDTADLCSGDEVQLTNFEYSTSPLEDDVIYATDKSGRTILITHVPTTTRNLFSIGMFVDCITVQKTSRGFRYSDRGPKDLVCDCGAKHTSTPEYHASWCTTNKTYEVTEDIYLD